MAVQAAMVATPPRRSGVWTWRPWVVALATLALATVAVAASACGEAAPAEPRDDTVAPADGADAAAGVDGASGDVAAGDGVLAPDADTGADTTPDHSDSGPPVHTATSPSQLSFGPPQPWLEPIADYITQAHAAIGSAATQEAIAALAPGPSGVLIGYGSLAPLTPTQGDPPPVAMRELLADDQVASGTPGHDAALWRFYAAPDGALWAPGGRPLDANATKGSLYRYPVGGPWQRFETVPQALHIFDVRAFGNALFAVGALADAEAFAKGEHYATMWRSDDGGAFFEPVVKKWNEANGTAHLRWLVQVGEDLVGLGIRRDPKGKMIGLPHYRWAGSKAEPLGPSHPLKPLLPLAVGDVAGGDRLAGGEDSLAPGDPVLWRLGAAGATQLDAAGATLVATWPIDATGETLLLERSSAGLPRVRLHNGAGGLKTLWQGQAASPALTAVAWRAGALVFGTSDGRLMRAMGAWKR